jgi:hypothetical protein
MYLCMEEKVSIEYVGLLREILVYRFNEKLSTHVNLFDLVTGLPGSGSQVNSL